MLHELTSDEFEKARLLFHGFDYCLSIHAAIHGNNPGRIFVDDPEQPQTTFALTVEGYLLAGKHDNHATNEALRSFLKEKIFTGEIFVNGDWSMSLAVHPQAWEAILPELIPTHEVEKIKRYHYLCDALKFDLRGNLPEEHTVRRLDRALLDDDALVFPLAMREFMDIEEMWSTEDNFLSKGIGFVVLHDRQIVASCSADCLAGDRIDVGLITHLAASAWALLMNREKALVYLAAAADHGWTNAESTKQQEEFSILHGTPKWDAILARMENASKV
jgi:hypothetical protein